ncbi:MAG: calcineurin-like phosphoesterase C-terminal domain-containing protein [Bacteroidales bacterium]
MKRYSLARITLMVFGCFFMFQTTYSQQWIASPQVITGGTSGETISGYVFQDTNKNGIMDTAERGVADVLVTNGLDWVRTDAKGYYELKVRKDMDLTIVQPSGWRVPTDEKMVPQFFYVHKEGGTGYPMRFGGLPDTGPAPGQVNFPLSRESAAGQKFSCAILADPQTYNNDQVGWLRDGVFAEIMEADYQAGDCMIQLGDVVGDDLDLLDRLLELAAVTNLPQWLVIGNHDVDFDARTNNDKADSWRRIYGPNYYAFEKGNVLFVVLDNIFYPCGEEDVANGRMNCAEDRPPTYNGRLTETQFTWFEGLIANTPKERLIVLNTHIPLVSYSVAPSGQHQTDELTRIYKILEGREAVSFSGHTHTTENHSPGQSFEGWAENTGIAKTQFRHIIAGAASGSWYQGDFNVFGVPMSLQSMGAPNGYFHVEFDGPVYRERYIGARVGKERGQWVALNTPSFREWYDTIAAWSSTPMSERDPIPPFSVNDLPDTKLLTPEDFNGGVWLTANVWAGSSETVVKATLSDGGVLTLERTQQGVGESRKSGSEWADAFATVRQLSVARYALQSTLGDEKAQGHELYTGRKFGPAPPQPQGSIANSNMHLWRVNLPELPLGVHTIKVESTDRNGLKFTDLITIEVRAERPPRYWRHEIW